MKMEMIFLSDTMTCPVCGREFDAADYQCLANGNPACPDCVAEERAEEDKE